MPNGLFGLQDPNDQRAQLANALRMGGAPADPMLAQGWDTDYEAIADYVARQRQQSAQMGLWGPQGITPQGVRAAATSTAMAPIMGTASKGDVPGFTAYHGSPHDFDQFDSSKIGTGEGAQAYGHGLYLADAEGVAKGYREGLSRPSFNGVPSSELNAPPRALDALEWLTKPQPGGPTNMTEAADRMQAAADDFTKQAAATKGSAFTSDRGFLSRLAQEHADAAAWLRENAGGELQPGGHLYEVHVAADPQHFLDWDKPLSEQHPVVQQAIENTHGISVSAPDGVTQLDNGRWAVTSGGNVVGQQRGWPTQSDANYVLKMAQDEAKQNAKLTGGDIMSSRRSTYTPEGAAEALQSAGIPGIRYLDAGSRGAADGTKNTVVFDPSILRIVRKYAIPAAMLSGTGHGLVMGDQE